MDIDLIQKVRAALNARVDGAQTVNIVIPVSDTAAQSMLEILDCAIKAGLLDRQSGTIDADGTSVPERRTDDGA